MLMHMPTLNLVMMALFACVKLI